MTPPPTSIEPLLQACRSAKFSHSTEAFRLFHGRGHCFPGWEFLTLDFFAPVLFLVLHDSTDISWLSNLSHELQKACPAAEALLIQHRYQSNASHELAWGTLPSEVQAQEFGLRYKLLLGQAQNTGIFLDMREGRRWLQERASGKSILNLFAYTCAFSVIARQAGAHRIVNIDKNRNLLHIGRDNHRLNGLSLENISFLCHDIFRSWGKLKRLGPYDILLIDPPQQQHGSFVARKDYKRLVRRIPSLVHPGGDILLCLNAPFLDYAFLEETMAEEAPDCVLQSCFLPPKDFPEKEPHRGLKMLHARYLPSQTQP